MQDEVNSLRSLPLFRPMCDRRVFFPVCVRSFTAERGGASDAL